MVNLLAAGRGESDWLDNKSEYTFATYQRDAAAMLARAGESTVDWVGTSMGGLIGIQLHVTPGPMKIEARNIRLKDM